MVLVKPTKTKKNVKTRTKLTTAAPIITKSEAFSAKIESKVLEPLLPVHELENVPSGIPHYGVMPNGDHAPKPLEVAPMCEIIESCGPAVFEPLVLKCPFCPTAVSKTNLLYSHIKSHQNHMTCPYCGKTSKCMAMFVNHVRNHTGEKPYKCPVPGCNFASAVKCNLKIHLGSAQHAGNETIIKYGGVLDLDVARGKRSKKKRWKDKMMAKIRANEKLGLPTPNLIKQRSRKNPALSYAKRYRLNKAPEMPMNPLLNPFLMNILNMDVNQLQQVAEQATSGFSMTGHPQMPQDVQGFPADFTLPPIQTQQDAPPSQNAMLSPQMHANIMQMLQDPGMMDKFLTSCGGDGFDQMIKGDPTFKKELQSPDAMGRIPISFPPPNQ